LKKYTLAAIVAVVAACLYAVLTFIGDAHSTVEALASYSSKDWAVILALSSMNYAIRFFRWERYIALVSGVRPHRMRHCLAYLAGFALTTTPGKAGEAIRSFYLRAYAIPISASLSALAVERLMDVLAITLMGALIAVGNPSLRWLVFASTVLVLLIVLLLQGERLVTWINRLASLRTGRWRELVLQVGHTLTSSQVLMRFPVAGTGLAAGVVAWGCEGVALAYILHALGADVSLTYAVGAYALAMLVGAASFLPGGLGGTEVTMTFLLVAGGAPLNVSIAAMMICRVATLWFAVLLGIVAMLILVRLQPSMARISKPEKLGSPWFNDKS